MTFSYDRERETDSLYIALVDRPSAESREVAPDVVADYDDAGRLVGLDVQHASRQADLARLDLPALPLVAAPVDEPATAAA